MQSSGYVFERPMAPERQGRGIILALGAIELAITPVIVEGNPDRYSTASRTDVAILAAYSSARTTVSAILSSIDAMVTSTPTNPESAQP
jgi:hypothetical protein